MRPEGIAWRPGQSGNELGLRRVAWLKRRARALEYPAAEALWWVAHLRKPSAMALSARAMRDLLILGDMKAAFEPDAQADANNPLALHLAAVNPSRANAETSRSTSTVRVLGVETMPMQLPFPEADAGLWDMPSRGRGEHDGEALVRNFAQSRSAYFVRDLDWMLHVRSESYAAGVVAAAELVFELSRSKDVFAGRERAATMESGELSQNLLAPPAEAAKAAGSQSGDDSEAETAKFEQEPDDQTLAALWDAHKKSFVVEGDAGN